MKAVDSLNYYGTVRASGAFVPRKILHRFVGRPKLALALEPQRVGRFPSFYPAADPFSDNHGKTLRRNNENAYTRREVCRPAAYLYFPIFRAPGYFELSTRACIQFPTG